LPLLLLLLLFLFDGFGCPGRDANDAEAEAPVVVFLVVFFLPPPLPMSSRFNPWFLSTTRRASSAYATTRYSVTKCTSSTRRSISSMPKRTSFESEKSFESARDNPPKTGKETNLCPSPTPTTTMPITLPPLPWPKDAYVLFAPNSLSHRTSIRTSISPSHQTRTRTRTRTHWSRLVSSRLVSSRLVFLGVLAPQARADHGGYWYLDRHALALRAPRRSHSRYVLRSFARAKRPWKCTTASTTRLM